MDDRGFHDTPIHDGSGRVWHHCLGHDRDTLVHWSDRDTHYEKCSTAALILREMAERSRRAEAAERLRNLHRQRREAHATR